MSNTAIPAKTTPEQTQATLSAAARAHAAWCRAPRGRRAEVLDALARALEGAVDRLVPIAMEETNLAEARLRGEVKRTAFQLSLFAEVLRDGEYLDARIDPADPAWPMGAPRPDLRRSLRPLGPVVVYSASNFPFAFSVLGGDTASALAAGNAVIVKAHDGHPRLSEATHAVSAAVLEAEGFAGLHGLVFGREAGLSVLKDSRIKAGGFTGSIPGGRALMDVAVSRPEPIPFYGELGSTNPVFVTKNADAARGADIAAAFVGSFTMSTGQFCTKPGMLFVPEGSAVLVALEAASLPVVAPMLNPAIAGGFAHALEALSGHDDVRRLSAGVAGGDGPAPVLLSTTLEALLAAPEALEAECFGPSALVVTYADEAQLIAAAATFEGQLTASLQAEESDDVAELVHVLAERAGRVLWNEWPTGVSVTYAQQHGGPYPATTAPGSTSVGTAAIERFLRPVAFQNFPQHLLPEELKDATAGSIPRRVNGVRVK